jgi:hypothetical protein
MIGAASVNLWGNAVTMAAAILIAPVTRERAV